LGPLHCARGEIDSTQQVADAALRLCTNHGIGLHYIFIAKMLRGWALARSEDPGEGIEQIREGIEGYCAMRAWDVPYLIALLADACLHAGQRDEGLAAVGEGLVLAEENGERIRVPELFCLKGQLLLSGPAQDANGAESCFGRALAAARELGAKSLELRAATSLARLWVEQGERQRAHRLLAPVYNWFTEGFGTTDLRNAKSLLERRT
jgi:predicted ATPase